MATPEFHTLKIKTIRQLADDAICLGFDVPPALVNHFKFIPGQFLTLRTAINGEDIRRSYSICSYHQAAELEVGIRQVPHGVFSNHAAQLGVGDSLQVMTPQGQFQAAINQSANGLSRNVLLLAAGSGITPCLSIAKSILQDEPHSRISLVYGNRSTSSTMFREDLDALKDRYTGRFVLVHVMSRELQDVKFLNGRLDHDRLQELVTRGVINVQNFDAIYLCGPFDMIESCKQCLHELGVTDTQLHIEHFTTENPGAQKRSLFSRETDEKQPVGESAAVEVSIMIDGSRRQIGVNPAEETILAAARRQGVDLPFSCAGGMCCTCRCKIIEGESTMDANYSLQAWEIEAGFTLACQTRPVSSRMVLDFDAS